MTSCHVFAGGLSWFKMFRETLLEIINFEEDFHRREESSKLKDNNFFGTLFRPFAISTGAPYFAPLLGRATRFYFLFFDKNLIRVTFFVQKISRARITSWLGESSEWVDR